MLPFKLDWHEFIESIGSDLKIKIAMVCQSDRFDVLTSIDDLDLEIGSLASLTG
jgi:hypothetical protein